MLSGPALGAAPPAVPRTALEESYVADALSEYGWKEDLNPEGKTIESVKIHIFQVFDRRDPIPNFVNIFHARTREWVAEQEVLLGAGQTWNRRLVLETERNLRAIRQISIANIVAVQGSSPDKVILLVVAKDVWSLRLNSNWGVGTNGLEFLLLNPTEENLAGLRASLGAFYFLERDTHTVGGIFAYPRMLGTKYSVSFGGGSIVNRDTGTQEGAYGSFSFSRPLWNRKDEWSYGTSASWSTQVVRRFAGGQLRQIQTTLADGTNELVDDVYDAEALSATYFGVRSFGFLHKLNVGFGLELDHRRFGVPVDSTASAEAAALYREEILPVSDRRISPYVSLSAFRTDFHRVTNLESLGIQEDWRLGYGVFVSLFGAAEALGSTRDLIGSRTSLGYTVAVGDGLARVGASNRIVVANENRHEAFVSARTRFASPTLLFGRLHLDGFAGHRYQDYLNDSGFRLGGNNRLRGYLAGEFPQRVRGTNIAVANAEFRTVGVDILSAQVGLAAFYDVGGVSDVFSEIPFYQGAGAGLRFVFPQIERTVMRFDFGLPLSGDRPVLPGTFFLTFGQAFSMPDSSGGL